MANTIDQKNFEMLAALDPEEVCKRTGAEYISSTKEFRIRVWGKDVTVCPAECRIEASGPATDTAHEYLYLFILYYLILAKPIRPLGEWVSQKDLAGGAAFFRGPHTLPTDRIVSRYDRDIAGFKKRAQALGGIPLEMADAAYVFHITPNIPVAVLFWLGDEDFPSESVLLFDRTIEDQLPLDIIYALAVSVCHALSRQGTNQG